MESIQSTSSEPVLHLDEQPQSESQLDVAPESSAPKVKSPKSKRAGSIAWTYCTKFQKIHEKRKEMWPFARCNFCKIEFPAHSAHNGTTHIVKHLKEVCNKCPTYEGGANSKGQSILSQGAMCAPLVSHTFNQKRIEETVYKWIIKDEQPFRAVEGVGFKAMIHEMYPKFKLPGRKKVAAGVVELYLQEKARIKSMLANKRVLWAFSIYLEAVAILPQLVLLQRSGNLDNLTGKYVFFLGAYRAFYILNWIYRYFTENHYSRWISWVAGLLQTALYADFFYYYFTSWKNKVKLQLPA